MKIECTCRCKDLPDDDFLKKIHDCDCAISEEHRRRSYPELIGNKLRGNKYPKVKLPDNCPVCNAIAIEKIDGEFAKRIYGCGGTYKMKPQIQNHTDYFWGSCKEGLND